ncbi:MAG: hypothetical protein J5862_01940, partial [Bacteroidales bacterium]|nr:hypothetical protein [Bacteroidales bacterium]
IKFYGDFFVQKDIAEFENFFKGYPHRRDAVEMLLQNVRVGDYLINVSAEDILNLLF